MLKGEKKMKLGGGELKEDWACYPTPCACLIALSLLPPSVEDGLSPAASTCERDRDEPLLQVLMSLCSSRGSSSVFRNAYPASYEKGF